MMTAMSASPRGGAAAGASVDRVERLSAEDRDILALENETVAGHSCKVIVLEDGIEPEALRTSIASRLDQAPRLGVSLTDIDGEPYWTPTPALDLNAHVVETGEARQVDALEFRETVARIFKQRLDRSRPLWRIDVIPELAWGGSALIWRIHHALADGWASMQMAKGALWDEEPLDEAAADASRKHPSEANARGRAHRPLSALRAAMRQSPQPWLRSPFSGRIDTGREVAFSSIELEGLRDVARATDGATLNDAILAVVSGALHRWLERRHGRFESVRVKVPVSLHASHAPGEDQTVDAGNRDSFFCLDLPVGSADPVERLTTIRQATQTRKDGHDAERLDALMRELGRVPTLRRFAERVLAHPRSFALNVSNVVGPRRPVRVLGARVTELYSLAEIRERHALRIAVVSLCDSMNFGLMADPSLLEGVAGLADDLEAEAAALIDRVEGV
jgi:diacylglycerol O-acyltransferase / wax synthase